MPVAAPAGFKLGTQQPADAVAAYAARGLLQPTFNWHDVWAEEHAAKFMVAGVSQADVLRLFHDTLAGSLKTGSSLADFAKAVKPALQAKGWWGDVEITNPATGEVRTTRFDDARLQLIYDTNLRQSYAAGRWAAIQRNKKRQPLLMYRTMRDERVRTTHRPWDGVVLPVDHPWWSTHYPPCGWRCRCRAFALSERDVQRYIDDGVDIKRDPPPSDEVGYRDPRTGETLTTPLGVDPGFGYNPGRAYLEHAATLERRSLDALLTYAPDLAAALVQQRVRGDEFSRFVAAPLPHEAHPVAVLLASAARQLGAKTRTLMLSADHPAGMAAADFEGVQQALDEGQALADGAGVLVYLLERDGWVSVVTVARSESGLVLQGLRRMTADQAQQDPQVLALRARGLRNG